jgi:hypothetical protein
MIITKNKVTEICYLVDEYCREFSKNIRQYKNGNQATKSPRMSDIEVITILISFAWI